MYVCGVLCECMGVYGCVSGVCGVCVSGVCEGMECVCVRCICVSVWSMSGVCVWCIGMKCGVYVLVVCVYGVVYEWSVCGVSGV